MTPEVALEILKMYANWNNGQKSVSLAFGGPRTAEDDIYDNRRKLIREAQDVLAGDEDARIGRMCKEWWAWRFSVTLDTNMNGLENALEKAVVQVRGLAEDRVNA